MMPVVVRDRRSQSRARAVLLALVPVLIASCGDSSGSDGEAASRSADGCTTPLCSVVASGLSGPTQVAFGPDDALLVAQLNGDENAGAGQVVRVDPITGEQRVLLTGLRKPTGVAFADSSIWVMVERGLLRAPWASGDSQPGPIEVVLSNLPFNGRSEGTLTVIPTVGSETRDAIVFETSGSTMPSGEAQTGGGALWRLDTQTTKPVLLANGLKNAYAHAFLRNGDLLVTDINDLAKPPRDELNVLTTASRASNTIVNFGWPHCLDAHNGTRCADINKPAVLFAPAATPTGVTIVGDDVYVALLTEGRIVRVDVAKGDLTSVIEGLQLPHTVLAERDSRAVLVTEHGTGRILRLNVQLTR
jgi:glucose/arabinose dehydrogenase